jgi:hypothetical protein
MNEPICQWPYSLPEPEMISRYNLRRLTEAEMDVFPGIPLALQVFKARLTRPPPVVPRARKGWVVWVIETYPGCFLARLPGGATIDANYNQMEWAAVPDETPATTLETVRAEDERLRIEAAKWRPGQVITTPGTRLSWKCLTGWLEGWRKLNRRAHSSDRYWKEDQHIRALPLEMIAAEESPQPLYDFLDVATEIQPPRGRRDGHPLTPRIFAAHNRLAQLQAAPYPEYRRQRALAQKPVAPALNQMRVRSSRHAAGSAEEPANLSLF